MRISPKASKRIQGMDKQASDVEKTMKRWLRNYGYELVRYVSNHVLAKEGEKISLERDIKVAEKKLADLKSKR